MVNLKHILMLSCEKASELIEKKSNFSLGTKEKVQLFIHTKVCDACKNYEKQSTEMDSLLNEHLKPGADSQKLPTKVKERIVEKLNAKGKD